MTMLSITINGSLKLRLIADEGMVLTNGTDKFKMIDVDALDGWSEEADNG